MRGGKPGTRSQIAASDSSSSRSCCPETSLARQQSFRQVLGPDAPGSEVVLWMNPESWSSSRSPVDRKTAAQAWSSNVTDKAGGFLDSMVQLQGLALGLTVEKKLLRVEGLVCAEGTLLEAMETMVDRGNSCAIGPRALSERCPAWTLMLLDCSLLTRSLPVVADVLKRITGQWGDRIRLPGMQERSSGIAAMGICGIKPMPTAKDDDEYADGVSEDIFAYIDAFLVLEILGSTPVVRLAGKVFDSVGDVVRGRLKKLRGVEEEQLTTVSLMNHDFFVSLRRGAIILATSRDALVEALNLLEFQGPETLSDGFLMGAECDPQRLTDAMGETALDGVESGQAAEIYADIQKLGRAKLDIKRVPAGLRLVLHQTDAPALSDR